MDKYIFREVLCPFCKKPYMTRIYEDYDCTVIHDGQTLNGWVDRCPKCDGHVFVAEGLHEGVDRGACELISGFTIH